MSDDFTAQLLRAQTQKEQATAEALGIVPAADPEPQLSDPEAQPEEQPPSFDGGVRGEPYVEKDPEREHGEFLSELLGRTPPPSGNGGWG